MWFLINAVLFLLSHRTFMKRCANIIYYILKFFLRIIGARIGISDKVDKAEKLVANAREITNMLSK